MRNPIATVFVFLFAAVAAFGQNTPPPASADDALKNLRTDMQGAKAAILGKHLTLTAEQAAKFWPVFEAFQKEQSALLDEQLKGVKHFVENYEKLDDETAVSLLNAYFDRETKMNSVRKKWLGEFQKVLPTKTAVRAMQIDRRLSMAQQCELSAQIPLVY